MSAVLIGFVGDMLVHREHPEEVFREVRDVLRVPDILFGNLEGMYTDTPHPSPGAVLPIGAPAHNLAVYSAVGFDVLAMASNHVLDMGYAAMLETRAYLRDQGIKTCGIGDCPADAHQPAILEADGLRIAFLAYACTFPVGYEARWNAPGLAPMRSYNVWRDAASGQYPGGMPLVTSVEDQNDLARLTEDIQKAREHSDLVITSFHWGDYSRPFHLTDHETKTARYCIDRGADMVIGHHHHTLRGMEWYKGKPIMYGLGHFVADFRVDLPPEITQAFAEPGVEDTSYRVGPRKGWPLLPLHKDARMTLLAWARAGRNGIDDIGFLPCRLTADGFVHPLRLDSSEGREVVDYLDKCNKTQNLRGAITAAGATPIAGFETLRVTPV
jgi:poly-gamma-glutamate capsule biosynthesis protein CapA/YwtB (metallophosphatase superfamily)